MSMLVGRGAVKRAELKKWERTASPREPLPGSRVQEGQLFALPCEVGMSSFPPGIYSWALKSAASYLLLPRTE